MNRPITRRDFLNGTAIALGATLIPACSGDGELVADRSAPYYPPAQMGMRGAHPGSFETAHDAVQGQRWPTKRLDEHYDLGVVGAGISGLSAAYIYRRDVNPNARILLLDNHDDFGGHAKRNEFTIDGRTLIGFGGTMMMEEPGNYPAVARQVIRELGFDPDRAHEFHHEKLHASLGISRGSFLDKETFGADYLAIGSDGYSEALEGSPLSTTAKAELKRLFADEEDYLAGMTPAERRAVIESQSWRTYLEKYAGIGEEALTFVQKQPHGVWAIGADAFPAKIAWLDDYPGFAGMDLGLGDEEDEEDEEDWSDFYFPDGNASIARLLVRRLVPEIASGNSMEDVVAARFDYSALDRPENLTRIRLESTVVNLGHQDGDLTAGVDVSYVRNNQGQTVTADRVIWAGYHAMLPYVCAEIPEDQTAALNSSVRAALVYTSVLVRTWQSFVDLGLWRAYCPGSFFHSVRIARPWSIGGYRHPQSPDEPMVLHLQHIPTTPGLTAAEQFRKGRQKLLETPFETFERNVRDQLGRMLGPGGFDPARDIAGITVNRWPHGYAFSVDAESDDVAWWPEYWQHKTRPWVDARQRIGNIAIAGTDASSNAMTESAIEEAHRAVHDLPG
ncbi:MAG: NAD(P)-binding protein [Gammaproteobacteria bacterium]